jgi:hypothetical protein
MGQNERAGKRFRTPLGSIAMVCLSPPPPPQTIRAAVPAVEAALERKALRLIRRE